MQKYEFTGEEREVYSLDRSEYITLHQIRALVDIDRFDVRAGDIGGWVESEKNLSQDGDAWVMHDAIVIDDATVSDNALVYEGARIMDQANVFGEAYVGGESVVKDCAKVYGHARVDGLSDIRDNARVFENARVNGCAMICDEAEVSGWAKVEGNMYGESKIYDHARLCKFAYLVGVMEAGGDTIIVETRNNEHAYADDEKMMRDALRDIEEEELER